VSSSEVSFSIHFPITCYDEFAKCRQFKRFQSFVSSFPSFGRGFDSHRPLIDAVGFTGSPPLKVTSNSSILDAVGRTRLLPLEGWRGCAWGSTKRQIETVARAGESRRLCGETHRPAAGDVVLNPF